MDMWEPSEVGVNVYALDTAFWRLVGGECCVGADEVEGVSRGTETS